jgi:hypothetical protein
MKKSGKRLSKKKKTLRKLSAKTSKKKSSLKLKKAASKKIRTVPKTSREKTRTAAQKAPRNKARHKTATVNKKASKKSSTVYKRVVRKPVKKSSTVYKKAARSPAKSSVNPPRSGAKHMLKKLEEIYHLKDLDSLLERILTEARRFTRADAGTIYLATKARLHFNFVQNDTLFKGQPASVKRTYLQSTLPLDKTSIAGYVAVTGKTIMIDDAYRMGREAVCSFNREWDEQLQYKTHSVLAVPITARNNTILGVLQLINARDGQGRTVPFSREDTLYISQFANSAGYAVENARLSREILRRQRPTPNGSALSLPSFIYRGPGSTTWIPRSGA